MSIRWINFSEYWTYRKGIAASERLFLHRRCRHAPDGAPIGMDIGANVGLFTVEMAALGFRCHSFEPIGATYERLNQNIIASGLQSQVTTNQLAVGDHIGHVVFRLDLNSPGTNHLAPSTGAKPSETSAATVRMTTVDSYMTQHKLPWLDVMKVDVEGLEPGVFKGSENALTRRAIKAILFEVCPPLLERAGESPDTLHRILRDFGYRVHRLAEDGSCGEELRVDHLNRITLANVTAVPR